MAGVYHRAGCNFSRFTAYPLARIDGVVCSDGESAMPQPYVVARSPPDRLPCMLACLLVSQFRHPLFRPFKGKYSTCLFVRYLISSEFDRARQSRIASCSQICGCG